MNSSVEIILKAGSAGGSVTLLGWLTEAGDWRFALAAVDHTAELVGEREVPGAERPSLEWVGSWQEGLKLLDRYPWVRLYPMEVHAAFVERVRAAVAERLAGHDERDSARIRQKWELLFTQASPP